MSFVLFLSEEGLFEGFEGRSTVKPLFLLLLAWISLPAVEGKMAKLEVGPDSLLIRSGAISMPPAEGNPRVASV